MAPLARRRRLLSGTPIANGHIDLFTQYWLLDPGILNLTSYYAFRGQYCVMGGYKQKEITGYINEQEILDKVNPYTFRVSKSDALDLPEKLFQKRFVTLPPEYRKVYNDMKNDLVAKLDDSIATANIALTVQMRLQQIVGGHLSVDTDIENEYRSMPLPGTNPKIEEVLNVLEEVGDQKVVIWCKFVPEILLLKKTLEEHKISHVAQWGGSGTPEEKAAARRQFRDDPSVRVYIGQMESGGIGINELVAASVCVYFSHSFSYIARAQSEDRLHRSGQKNPVLYIDLVAENTLDSHVLKAVKEKKNYSNVLLEAIRHNDMGSVL